MEEYLTVKELSDKGFSEPEMIDVLRKEGFSAEEIDRGLTQALELKVSGTPEPQPSFQSAQPLYRLHLKLSDLMLRRTEVLILLLKVLALLSCYYFHLLQMFFRILWRSCDYSEYS